MYTAKSCSPVEVYWVSAPFQSWNQYPRESLCLDGITDTSNSMVALFGRSPALSSVLPVLPSQRQLPALISGPTPAHLTQVALREEGTLPDRKWKSQQTPKSPEG